MAEYLKEISIVIPVRTQEEATKLLQQLEGHGAEIIVSAEEGRAKSLNLGAAQASRKFLWFLHADSILPEGTFSHLQQSLQQNEAALHYFDLKFANDGPGLIRLNAWGANMRAQFLGLPFGDQGLCIRKDLFFKTGGYPEHASYGEDHLFTWQARRHGIKLKPVGAFITTSAIAYKKEGWLKLTLQRQFQWVFQALPQWWKWVRGI